MKELPRGIRIDHGYVQVRLRFKGQMFCKNFGKDNSYARYLATMYLYEKRKEILEGRFGIVRQLPRKKFSEVADLYFERWSKQIAPEGHISHSERGRDTVRYILNSSLKAYFGDMWYDEIKPKDVQNWRERRTQTVLGTTANREQVVLSSLFTNIHRWISLENIAKFQIPQENPCKVVQKAKTRKRTRLLTTQELKVLKEACFQRNDGDMWDIVKLALKSLLRKSDLQQLDSGKEIDIIQSKTNNDLSLPVMVDKPLNYINFRKRWIDVRRDANLEDVQFRDLRKTGANLLKLKNHSNKLISEFLGHSSTATTELYMVRGKEHLAPLAKELSTIVEAI